MFCRFCGKEIADTAHFCPECGANLSETVTGTVHETYEEAQSQKPRQAKCWTIFAKVGYGLGLGGFISSFIPFVCIYGLIVAAHGLVFSILGKRSYTEGEKAVKGIKYSAFGIGISITMWILSWVLFSLAIINA